MPLQDDVLNRTHCCSPVQVFLISVISVTALMFSCASGTLEITRFLVESGANLEAAVRYREGYREGEEYDAPKPLCFKSRALLLQFGSSLSNFCSQWPNCAIAFLLFWAP